MTTIVVVATLAGFLLISGFSGEAAAQGPTVVSTNPANGATNVSRAINVISVTFSKAMNTNGVSIGSTGWGSSAWGYGNQDTTFYYSRSNDLAKLTAGSTITFTLNGQGTTGFQDTSGNPLPTYTFSFTIGNDADLQRIDANPARGFYWPYFLSIPTSVGPRTVLLVEPNNTGTWSDDPVVHENAARNLILSRSDFATDLGVPLLVPTFPRPINPQAPEPGGVYTQALDRYSLYLPTLPVNLQRIDLQLIAMIKDAKERLAAIGHLVDRKVFFMGFSASGAFVSRFAALHPEIVKAVAPGSPGGWPIAPVSQWSGTNLRYPVGVSDVEQLVGKAFDLNTFKKVPKYIYVGDVDTNDALDLRDMPQTDRDQICALLNCSPRPFIANRWPIAEQMYNSAGTSGQFIVYPGVVHTITTREFASLHTFFEQNKHPWISSSANILVDFDGDGKSDTAVYRGKSGDWLIIPSGGSSYTVTFGGDTSDKPVPGDYDGDGATDIAFYRTSTGTWYIKPSSGSAPYAVGWGGDPSDKPVNGDYDGDGKTDVAFYRSSTGVWWITPSSGASAYGYGWGGSGFKPVPGDYDGDGKTDIAIYNTMTGAWWIIPSSGTGPQGQAGAYGMGWGGSAFKPVPGDYDGDGKIDIAIYDTSTGGWWIIPSSGTGPQGQTGAYGVGWGGAGFTPVPGDYDGDGKADIAIYQSSNGGWWIIRSSDGSTYGVGWGGDVSDVPLTTNPD